MSNTPNIDKASLCAAIGRIEQLNASRVAAPTEQLAVRRVDAASSGSPMTLAEAEQMERATWETANRIGKINTDKINKLRAEIDASREKWAIYYGLTKRLRAAKANK